MPCQAAPLVLQAIARSHRIGQKREVRVIHLEAVADPLDNESVGFACQSETSECQSLVS